MRGTPQMPACPAPAYRQAGSVGTGAGRQGCFSTACSILNLKAEVLSKKKLALPTKRR